MTKAGLWLISLAFAPVCLRAQVSVDVVFDEDQFLRGEAIKAAVRITNLSGRDLHLGGEEDWLTFTVESREGAVVSRLADVPVKGEFVLESARRATKRVNLEPYFNFGRTGRYAVVANVRIKDWDQERKSEPKPFYVIEGARLWEQDFGVPRLTGATNGPPEIRKYVLQQANYRKDHLRLYLRVSDESGAHIIRTVPIGTILSFSRPEPQIDKFSNLHIIYQSWARTFSYSVFTPDGELKTRETYDYVDTRPRLQVDSDGFISVIGGVKRIAPEESLPATSPQPATDLQAGHP